MKVTFRLAAPLRPFAGGQSEVTIRTTAETLAGVLGALGKRHEELVEQIVDQEGRLGLGVVVFIGDRDARFLGGLEAELADGDVVTFVVPQAV